MSSVARTIQAVLWSFLGVRKNAEYQKDTEQLNPFVLIAVGLVVALMFVLGLMALVNWVAVQPTGH